MKNQKLLTIAIPTYNRCTILDETIQSYISDPDFDDRVEIIISDNCSTDETRSVVSKYSSKYKNVIYSCNPENIKDKNFANALSLGTGRYLKLVNDTAKLNVGTLKKFLMIIQNHLEDGNQIFFYQNTYEHKNESFLLQGLDQFVKTVSYFSTWILNFGAWQEDFLNLKEKDRFVNLQFSQVDWTFRLVERAKSTIVYYDDFFTVLDPGKKNTYNFFNVFINNYLQMFDEPLKNSSIHLSTVKNEKKKFFRNFVMSWIKNIFITKISKDNYDTSDFLNIVFRKFWKHHYFYVGLCKLIILKVIYSNKITLNIYKNFKAILT